MAFDRLAMAAQRRVWLTGSLAALMLGLLATRAAAAPSAAERDTARALMNDGDRLRAEGDRRAALAHYQAAHAIMHVPTTGFDVAALQAELGLLVEARASAMEVINLPDAERESEVFHEARRGAAALVTELEPRVPSVQTIVGPARADFSVTIDDVTLPRDARRVKFRTDPGPHRVRVAAPGFKTSEQMITLAEGEACTLSVLLESTLTVSSQAVVDTAQPATVDAGHAARVRGIAALSVGGAVLALGAVTGILSVVEANHQADVCAGRHCPPTSASALSTANTLANVANVSIPLGVLAIGYGIFELVTQPKTDEGPPAAQLGIGVGSVTVRGRL